MNPKLLPQVKPREIGHHEPKDYLMRFAFGAAISFAAGLIGMKFGPVVGGVFLGFPAILPASLTLIEKKDGRRQASIDSLGAVLGAAAMIGFALVVVLWAERLGVVLALVIALLVWLAAAFVLYVLVAATVRKEPAPP